MFTAFLAIFPADIVTSTKRPRPGPAFNGTYRQRHSQTGTSPRLVLLTRKRHVSVRPPVECRYGPEPICLCWSSEPKMSMPMYVLLTEPTEFTERSQETLQLVDYKNIFIQKRKIKIQK